MLALIVGSDDAGQQLGGLAIPVFGDPKRRPFTETHRESGSEDPDIIAFHEERYLILVEGVSHGFGFQAGIEMGDFYKFHRVLLLTSLAEHWFEWIRRLVPRLLDSRSRSLARGFRGTPALTLVILLGWTPPLWAGGLQFTDVTRRAGIDWTHENGATPEKYLIETMGGGAAFFDFDNDGWLDIYLVDSGTHQGSTQTRRARNALYRNNHDGSFTDVSEKAGVAGREGCYGNGAAVGDYDNDGWSDLYVTCFGSNLLYRNLGDGTFEEVAAKAGVTVGKWSSSAAFFDADNDGDLDLFVCIYLDWTFENNPWCGERKEGYRSYCHPDFFHAIPSRLFRNNGDGTFSDATVQAGVDVAGKALGVVTGDVDGDGYADIYVANDAVANFFYHNRGDGTFEEKALLAEVAYGSSTKPESGMGTDFGDVNGDGRLDLIVTNIDYEMNNLYSYTGGGYFNNDTVSAGLGQAALLFSGFGVRFADLDSDGDLDLVVLNGHPLDNINMYRSGVTGSETPMIFENDGAGRFSSVAENAGEVWKKPVNGRALASGDYDNDGDPDFLFVCNGQRPELIRNDSRSQNAWIGFQLVGSKSNRDGVGATLSLKTNRRVQVRQRQGGGSYQAAHDGRILFGLSSGERLESVSIRWPSGVAQEVTGLQLRQYHVLREPSQK